MAVPAVLLPEEALANESQAPPRQGEWTWDDYCRLPDDGRRYEIIRGALYVSPAPIVLHQYVVSRLNLALLNYAESHGGLVLGAPLDVILGDPKTPIAGPVQPDLAFWSADNLPDLDASRVERAPDLVVEVLSPSTARLDQHVKFSAYEDAGVREYWIVDPKARTVALNRLVDGPQDDPDGGGWYEEAQRALGDEAVESNVLPHLELTADDLFP